MLRSSAPMPDGPEKPESPAGFQRLPPNPRKRKIPIDQRKRVIKACNSCHVRRIKCSGGQPCTKCDSGSRLCQYPLSTQRTKSSDESNKELLERCLWLERCLADAIPSEKERETLLARLADAPAAKPGPPDTSSRSEDDQEKTGDGRILQDQYGRTRYLGESSGAAFIDRLREFVVRVLPLLPSTGGHPLASTEKDFTSLLGQYHTHDSKPLLLPQVDPFHLPPVGDARKLLAAFRYYGQEGVEGGIYYWGNLWDMENLALSCIESPGSSNDAHLLANLNMVFALACQYDPTLAPSWEAHPGETYFARAKYLLVNPIEDAKVSNMRTMCLMGQYLLGLYRRDAAYLYVGLACRMAVVHGLHKGWMIYGQGATGEQIKREFWNAYILDRWLSCLMGRPSTIPRDAIDLEYPADVPNSNLPLATGLNAHAKLSMIMDEIVNEVYGVTGAGQSISEICPGVHVLIQKLNSWRNDLPPSLQHNCHTGSDRSSLILNMLFNQLMILCTRPFVFVAAKQAIAAKYNASRHQQRSSNTYFMTCCLTAARNNTQLSRRLFSTSQSSVVSTLDYHHAFTAAIAILLARLVPEIASSEDEKDIEFLSTYLREAGNTGNESAGECGIIVRGFAAVVSRLLDDSQRQQRITVPILVDDAVPGPDSTIGFSNAPVGNQSDGLSISHGELDITNLPETELATLQELFTWFEDTSY